MATASLLECAKRQPKPKTLSRKYQYLIFSRAVAFFAGPKFFLPTRQTAHFFQLLTA
jgi:hypothetical protein